MSYAASIRGLNRPSYFITFGVYMPLVHCGIQVRLNYYFYFRIAMSNRSEAYTPASAEHDNECRQWPRRTRTGTEEPKRRPNETFTKGYVVGDGTLGDDRDDDPSV